jgi:hypothetical protein
MKIGQCIKTINADSGEVEFLRVTNIYGCGFFARKIPESEVSQNVASTGVRPAMYKTRLKARPQAKRPHY